MYLALLLRGKKRKREKNLHFRDARGAHVPGFTLEDKVLSIVVYLFQKLSKNYVPSTSIVE